MSGTNRALYEMADAYRRIMDLDDTSEWETALDEMAANIGEHVEGLATAALALNAGVVTIQAEIDRLTDLMGARARRATAIRGAVLRAMELANLTRVDGKLLTVRTQLNPATVEVADVETLPAEFQRVIPERREADKRALLDAAKAGRELPEGVTVRQSMRLVIR